jgi:N-acetylglucosaminyldiphosphoundecaprenol N-acetyl-beta-D-mannosaminyltransferase
MSAPGVTRRVEVLGVPIDPLTMEQVLDRAENAIESRRPLQIGVVNAAKVVRMRRVAALRDAVAGCDLILADGMSVVWAGRLLGASLPERVAGIDLMHGLLRLADRRGYGVYCLGAESTVLERALEVIRTGYPKLRIAGARHGYFEPAAEPALADEIRRARPDVLLVAMTSPMKEKFIARWGRTIAVPVVHGVGGSFDVLAGKVRRAPRVWQRLGLEWLLRLAQEPRRLALRYLETNTVFILLVLRELSRRALARARRRGEARRPWQDAPRG